MDEKDIRTLKILEEIGNDQSMSQRDLAVKLNISLGLVNSFVKRLASKGFFKITSVPKNRVKYILTPSGAAEKARLTYEYIHYSYRFYKKARKKLVHILNELESQGINTIAFYGTGDFAEIAYISLQETTLKLVKVIDEERSGENFLGIKIEDFTNIYKNTFDKLLITKLGQKEDIINEIVRHKISKDKVVIVDWK